jgi:hypothetical protein
MVKEEEANTKVVWSGVKATARREDYVTVCKYMRQHNIHWSAGLTGNIEGDGRRDNTSIQQIFLTAQQN